LGHVGLEYEVAQFRGELIARWEPLLLHCEDGGDFSFALGSRAVGTAADFPDDAGTPGTHAKQKERCAPGLG